jgi:hypothetical protein
LLEGRRSVETKRAGWLGFDGRIFLTEQEHETYCRRLPVRYAAKNLHTKLSVCEICKNLATPENPLQAAHRIPFGRGIIQFWLTPDWLDRPHNLVWAHKRICNKMAEIPDGRILEYLKEQFGIILPKHVSDAMAAVSK